MCLCITQLIFSLQEGHFTHDSNFGLFKSILCSTPCRLHELLNLVRQDKKKWICWSAEVWRFDIWLCYSGEKWCSACSSPPATPCESTYRLQSERLWAYYGESELQIRESLHQTVRGNMAGHIPSDQTPTDLEYTRCGSIFKRCYFSKIVLINWREGVTMLLIEVCNILSNN